MSRSTVLVLGGGFGLVAGLLAGCGGGASSSTAAAAGGQPTPAQTATPTPATTTVTRTVTPSPRPSSGPGASRPPTSTLLPRCDGPSLTVAVGAADGAAGSVYRTIVFRNGSAVACTLQGYPGVAAADAAGTAVVDAKRDTSQPATRVVLGPGASGHAVLRARNLPAGSAACDTYPQLLVTPPDSRRTSTLPVAVTPCERVFVVGPVAAGATA